MSLLGDLVKHNARTNRDKTALIYRDVSYSYAEMYSRVCNLAHNLIKLGIEPEDRVCVLGRNSHRYIECYFGIPLAGGIIVPLNWRYAPPEFSQAINNAGPKILLVAKDWIPVIQSIRGELNTLEELICLDDAVKGKRCYEDMVTGSVLEAPDTASQEDDTAAIIYTGGTTGLPKGAMLTHRNIITNALQTVIEARFWHDQVHLNVPPLFHVGSMWGMSSCIAIGGTNVVLEETDPLEKVLETIEKYRVTSTMLVPSQMDRIVSLPELKKYDVSSLRMVLDGASPWAPERIKRFIEVMDCDVLTGAGQTEATTFLACMRYREHVERGEDDKLGAAGIDVLGCETRVINDNDEDVPVGTVGELIGCGPKVMKGYWNMPEETARALRNGWLHTEDLVRKDEDGYIYYVDRKKDMIISGGENIYSREVEEAIGKHPAVLQVAVIGVPDEEWGESLKAIIVLRDEYKDKVSAQEIIEHCKKYIASYKKPKTVEFRDSLPMSPAGKILKYELREPYWKGHERRVH